jgi:DNA-binding transcriptional LysR family regulator
MLDWDDLRFFLAVARHGSLSAAAKDLHVAQSTVGRRLTSLEAGLGVRLLDRTPDGYVPTQAGIGVRVHAERLEAAATALERDVGGRDLRLAGIVRVSCAETIAALILAPGLATLHIAHPDIVVELLPHPGELSLPMREADISVCLQQPEQHELVVRRIGSIAFALYGSPSYLARHAEPDFTDGGAGHHVICQTADIQDTGQIGWLANRLPHARVSLQTGSHEAAVAAAAHGGGLACLARFRADHVPGLIRLSSPPVPIAGIWLVVHRDNRHTPRIRVALTHVAACVKAMAGQLLPVI